MGRTLTPALSRKAGEGETWAAFWHAGSGGSGLFWQPKKRL